MAKKIRADHRETPAAGALVIAYAFKPELLYGLADVTADVRHVLLGEEAAAEVLRVLDRITAPGRVAGTCTMRVRVPIPDAVLTARIRRRGLNGPRTKR